MEGAWSYERKSESRALEVGSLLAPVSMTQLNLDFLGAGATERWLLWEVRLRTIFARKRASYSDPPTELA